MPVSPATAEHLAAGVVSHYQDAEAALVARIAKNLSRGIDAPFWAEQKLAQMQEYERQARRLLADLEKKAADGVSSAITDAYERGGLSAVADIAKLQPGVAAVESLAGLRAVEALTQETLGNVLATHNGILRSTMDAYRSVIAESSSGVLLGDQTRRQAAQAALNRFAQKGITGITDKAGRALTMESYTEMAMRTACGRAAVQGHVDRLTANGLDLVIVSDAPRECPACSRWEGKVLSIGGAIEMPEDMDPAFQVAQEDTPTLSADAGDMTFEDAMREQEKWDGPAGWDVGADPGEVKAALEKGLAGRLAGDPDFDRMASYKLGRLKGGNLEAMAGFSDEQRLEYAREHLTKVLVDNWAGTSGDRDPLAYALQSAAQREFGLTGSTLEHLGSMPEMGKVLEYIGDTDDLKGLRSFLRAMHGETQDYFASRGITDVVVYRGTKESLIDGYGRIAATLQPMSSFSTEFNTAVKFANGHTVIAARVPVGQIIGTCKTGFGCLGEREIVVLGSTGNVAALNVSKWYGGKLWATLWKAMRGMSE